MRKVAQGTELQGELLLDEIVRTCNNSTKPSPSNLKSLNKRLEKL